MEFLAGSLLELIVQTSTNLPPDVRAAMSMTAAAETPETQSAQALDIILSNIDMAADDTGAICQDTGMPTFVVHTPVVTVDVALKGALPLGARPDLSVDGTVQLEQLNDVLNVGCPVYGQENATVQLFKIEPNGKYANKVKVTFRRRSVSYIEIKSGLNAGDRVILSDMSSYDNYDRIKLN